MITGEAGTGKKTFAHYIHQNSSRGDGPFVDMGVGGIARENSETELFGSEADGDVYYGRLEQANGGTLLLDEVADMDTETQKRLISALESHSFLRVGGNEPVKVNVRIIATTHKDMEQEVLSGRFREDLYYQLNVVPLHIPTLREHYEDIPGLLNYYVDHYATADSLPYRRFSVAAQNRLRNHTWPGNIRELKNLVQHLLILREDEEIDTDEVEVALSSQPQRSESMVGIAAGVYDLPLREARERFEREYLVHQLQICNGSVGSLSKLVGMERTNLYRKLRSLGIDVKQGK